MIGHDAAPAASRVGRRLANLHARQQLQLDIERLLDGRVAAAASDRAPVVGIASLSGGPWHLGIDILLGHALRLRGARPEVLVCDLPDLPICDERMSDAASIERCAGCVADKRPLLDASALAWRGLGGFVAASAFERARAIVAAVADRDLGTFEYGGWPIGQWLHVSASHYLRRDARGDDSERVDARRRLLRSAIILLDAAAEWLDWLRPDAVVVLSGAHLEWRIVLELARARRIPVTCREMGKGGWDHHLYSLNSDSMSPDLCGVWAQARHEVLSPAEETDVDAFVDALPERTYTGAAAARTSAGTAHTAARTIVAFANVTWDLATAGRDVAFTGVVDWLRDTVRALQTCPDVTLIIRCHPAEASVATREHIAEEVMGEWPDGLPGVIVIGPEDGTSAAELCARADLVTVYNSTAGLEAAVRGNTVLVCGDPHYRSRGFTVDVDSREGYARRLREFAAGAGPAAPPDAPALARRYVHLFYLRYHMPMTWTTSPLEPPYALTVRSLGELAPGANPVLDVVCDGILHGRQALLPRHAAGAAPCAR